MATAPTPTEPAVADGPTEPSAASDPGSDPVSDPVSDPADRLYRQLEPLAPKRQGWLTYLPMPNDYRFAAEAAELPVHGFELRALVPVLPLAFRRGPRWQLVGLAGLQPGQGLFVGPRGGWAAPAVPDVLKQYPFALRLTRQGRGQLLIDRASERFGDRDGEPLFADDGSPSAAVEQARAALTRQGQDRRATAKAIAALADAGVLVPWQAEGVGVLDPRVHWCVDAQALNGLDTDAKRTLIEQGALPLAYAQLFSVANLKKLRFMAQRRQQGQARIGDLLQGEDDFVLDFSEP